MRRWPINESSVADDVLNRKKTPEMGIERLVSVISKHEDVIGGDCQLFESVRGSLVNIHLVQLLAVDEEVALLYLERRTIPNQGSGAITIQQTCRGSFSGAPKSILKLTIARLQTQHLQFFQNILQYLIIIIREISAKHPGILQDVAECSITLIIFRGDFHIFNVIFVGVTGHSR